MRALLDGMRSWWDKRKAKDDPPASIVLLLKRPKPLNVQFLAGVLSQAAERPVRPLEIDSNPASGLDETFMDMVTGKTPHFMARIGDTTYVIHSLAHPYMDNSVDASEAFPELRLRKAIRDHQAWLSMDVIPPEAASPEAYRIAARVLAKLADEACLALFHPPLNRFVPFSLDETPDLLSADDPIQAVFGGTSLVPVVPIDDDPRLKAAEAEARRRFPEFVQAFERGDGVDFSVKAWIHAPNNSEHIWVSVDRIVGGTVYGRLGNEPVDLDGLRLGSRVEVNFEQLEDWVYLGSDGPKGMLTVPVLQQILSEQACSK